MENINKKGITAHTITDMNELNSVINYKSGMSTKQRQKALLWLTRQNDSVLLEIFKIKKNHFHRLKDQELRPDLTILDMVSFILAIKEFISKSTISNKKNRSNNFGFLKDVASNRAMQMQKQRKKHKQEILMDMHNLILHLIKKKHLSYRQVSQYLLLHHRFKVSHTVVGTFFNSIKKEGEKADGN